MSGVSVTKAINTCMLIVSCTYCRGLFRFLDAVVDPTLTAFYILNGMTNTGRTGVYSWQYKSSSESGIQHRIQRIEVNSLFHYQAGILVDIPTNKGANSYKLNISR